jgi:hypothetical protein
MADNTATCPWFLMIGLKKPDGTPLTAGSITCYDAGTTAIKVIYSDRAMTTPASQPVSIGANGYGGVLQLFGMGNYKFVIKDSEGAVVQTIDNVYLGRDSAVTPEEQEMPLFIGGLAGWDGELLRTGTVTLYDTGTTTIPTIFGLANPFDIADKDPIFRRGMQGDFDIEIKDEDGAVIRTLLTVFVGQTLGGG